MNFNNYLRVKRHFISKLKKVNYISNIKSSSSLSTNRDKIRSTLTVWGIPILLGTYFNENLGTDFTNLDNKTPHIRLTKTNNNKPSIYVEMTCIYTPKCYKYYSNSGLICFPYWTSFINTCWDIRELKKLNISLSLIKSKLK